MSKKTENIKSIIGKKEGQSLMEVLIAIGIATVLLGSSVYIGRSVLRSNSDVKKTQAATNLAQELMDNVRVYADANWSTFYNTSKGSSNHYNIDSTGSTYALASGDDVVTQNSVQFTRYFYAENVYRDSNSDAISDSGGVLDTSTQKVTVKVFWEGKEGISISEYVVRYRSYVFLQTDWSGGISQSIISSLNSVSGVFSSYSSISATGTAGEISLQGYNTGEACGAGQYFYNSSCIDVGTGFYSPAADNNRYSCPAYSLSSGSGTGADSISDCLGSAGYYGCQVGSCSEAGQGYYSPASDNSHYFCDAGRYGSSTTNYASTCDGACSAGYYGEAGATSATCNGACTAGYYCTAGSTSATQNNCGTGNYCVAGSGSATQCPGGTFGSTANLATITCSGQCTANYWCGAGSVSATQNACGANTYSPQGSDASNDCVADTTAPTHDSLTVSSSSWVCNGTNTYTLTLKSTETQSGFGGSYGIMALINYQGSNAGNYRGYFSWHPTTYVWTLNQVSCSGGGYASKYAGYGDTYNTLTACSTSVDGNQRTVIFTVKPGTNFGTYGAINDVSMYTTDIAGNARGWTNFDTNFSSTGFTVIATYSYTGGNQTFTVPSTGNYRFELWGGKGSDDCAPPYGGNGAHISGIVNLTADTQLTIVVGSSGQYGGWPFTNGGYNGGHTNCLSGTAPAGGATDVRAGGTALENRIIVAGGGGSCSIGDCLGGVGAPADGIGSPSGAGGGNGTAGTLGIGGDGGHNYGGCGGGGYYGGGGGSARYSGTGVGGGGAGGGSTGGVGGQKGGGGGGGSSWMSTSGYVFSSPTYASDSTGDGQVIIYQ